MWLRIMDSLKFDVTKEEIQKSTETKEQLIKKQQEKTQVDEIAKAQIEEGWQYDEPLRKARYVDDRNNVVKFERLMKEKVGKARVLKDIWRKEFEALQSALHEGNSSFRRSIVQLLSPILEKVDSVNSPLEINWEIDKAQSYMKDLGDKGIGNYLIYEVRTNQGCVVEIKRLIRDFLFDQCGARSHPSNRTSLVAGDSGTFRELSLQEILDEVLKLEKQINLLDPKQMVSREITEGQLKYLKQQGGRGQI